MSGRIRSKFQCLKRLGQYFKVKKDKVKIPMFLRRRPKFQCLEG